MATEFKENLDLVVGYTQKFIDAVTPVAKQAYEVGLMTLQIDALSVIVQSIVLSAVCGAWLWFAVRKELATKDCILGWHVDLVFPIFVSVGAAIGALWSATNMFSVWLWVELLKPDLWLAHQAVEKLLK